LRKEFKKVMRETREVATVDQATGEIAEMNAGIDVNSAGELLVSPNVAAVIQEIQGAMIMARRFPRDEKACFARLMRSCQRKTMAEKACYAFPRAGQTITGPSINLARVAGQCYNNLRWGLDVLRNDDSQVMIRGWAWDIENNIKVSADDSFAKLIYRKSGGWMKPDERDLRELINRRGAILVRNCLLNILPRDLIEDAMGICRKTLKSEMKDPDSEKKILIINFMNYGVTTGMIDQYLEHDTWTPDDILDLQAIYLTIKEGQSKVEDYFSLKKDEVKTETGLSEAAMTPGAAEKHQGFGKPDPAKKPSETEKKGADFF